MSYLRLFERLHFHVIFTSFRTATFSCHVYLIPLTTIQIHKSIDLLIMCIAVRSVFFCVLCNCMFLKINSLTSIPTSLDRYAEFTLACCLPAAEVIHCLPSSCSPPPFKGATANYPHGITILLTVQNISLEEICCGPLFVSECWVN